MSELVQRIAASPYAAAGLSGATSVAVLSVGPSTAVFDNAHLAVTADLDQGGFVFTYVDGSKTPWTRRVAAADGYAVLERFLTRRARWYGHRAQAGR